MKNGYRVILVFLSGMLSAMAFSNMWMIMALVALIPLYLVLPKIAKKKSIFYGFIFGMTQSVVLFSWIIEASSAYSGMSWLLGLGVMFLISCFFSLFTVATFYLYAWINDKRKLNPLHSVILVSVLLLTFTEGRIYLMPNYELLGFHYGLSLAENLYLVQWASLLGMLGLSIIVVSINALFAMAIMYKNLKTSTIPFITMCLLFGFGWLMQHHEARIRNQKNTYTVAIATHNFESNIVWDNTTGDSLAQTLIELNQLAINKKPELIVWSETTIPWLVSQDDDLLKALALTASQAGVETIIGCYYSPTNNAVYNAALHIDTIGVISSYHKHNLLALLEKPIGGKNGLFMPFVFNNEKLKQGRGSKILQTQIGKAYVNICNESVAPYHNSKKEKSIDFLLNVGNDAWFTDIYHSDIHFYYNRVQAVAERKDAIVNLNRGFCGLIQSSGEIQQQEKNTIPLVQQVLVAI